MDEHTAKFLDAQDEAAGIPKDSKDSWRAVDAGGCAPPIYVRADDDPGYLITKQPIETMAIHLPVAKGMVKINPDGSVEIPEGISTDAAADAFWQSVKAKGLADAQAQRIRGLQERVEGAEKALNEVAETPNAGWMIARAYFAARTKAGEPHEQE